MLGKKEQEKMDIFIAEHAQWNKSPQKAVANGEKNALDEVEFPQLW